jgi:branched-chain amino acid transport system ATP-binding protein
MSALLKVEGIDVFYGPAQAIWGASFEVNRGQLVSLVGTNGAGKTTTLRTICGLLDARAGRIFWDGREITGLPVHAIMDLGISLVPEGRQLFPKMSVEENLTIGSYLRRTRANRKRNLDYVYELFPRLSERRRQLAETMSGGEQQMLAIGRALMQEPRFLMLDEPSLGLAPVLVQEIFRIIKDFHDRGLTTLLVEQNVSQTLQLVDYAYVIENGRIFMEGKGRELADDPKIREAYLGF